MAEIKRYEEMKDSGIEWIGEIPENWSVSKIKNFSSILNGDRTSRYPQPTDFVTDGIPFLTSYNIDKDNVDTTNCKYITLEKYESLSGVKIQLEDIVFCLRGSIGKCAINKHLTDGTVASSLCVVRPYNICSEFLAYCLLSEIANQQTQIYMNGTCAANLSAEAVANYYIAFPQIKEQQAIADYLDTRCSQIDEIIEEAKKSIEDYKALKAAVIQEAVTKGLNPDVEMKESGIEWIGEIPEHWKKTKLQHLFRIEKRIAGQEGFTVLSITQKGIIPKDMKDRGQFALDYSKYQMVYPGDFAMNHMDLLTGWVDISEYEGVTSPDYRVFVNKNPNIVFSEYYKYIFQACYTNRIFYGLGHGVSGMGRWRLPADMFLHFELPLPPMEEQNRIARYISNATTKMDELIREKENLITDLEKYKKSLIYEVVTGKRKVT